MMVRRATVAAMLIAASLAGCGGSAAGDDEPLPVTQDQAAPPGPPGAGDGQRPQLSEEQRAQFQEFTDCLRDNGVEMPNGQGGGRPQFDPQDPAVQSAFQACQDKLPSGGGFPSGGPPGGAPPEGAAPPAQSQ